MDSILTILFQHWEYKNKFSKIEMFLSDIRMWLGDYDREGKIFSGNIGTSVVKNSYISKDAFIGDFCIIRNSIILAGAKVGGHAQINLSVIGNNTELPHHNNVAYSVLGENVLFGACTVTSSRRLDNKKPFIHLSNGATINAKEKLTGALIGNNVKIGSHVNINPFCIVLNSTTIFPCKNITGIIGHKTLIKKAQQWYSADPKQHGFSN